MKTHGSEDGEAGRMNEIAKWMIVVGSVVAAVGLVVFGIGTSFVRPEASEINLGLILMIGGLVVFFPAAVFTNGRRDPTRRPTNRSAPRCLVRRPRCGERQIRRRSRRRPRRSLPHHPVVGVPAAPHVADEVERAGHQDGCI